jgi:hypothetical protein
MARDTDAGKLGGGGSELDGGLLIRRDHVLVLRDQGSFELPGVGRALGLDVPGCTQYHAVHGR